MTSLRRTKLDVAEEGAEEASEAEVVPVVEVPEEHLDDLEVMDEVEQAEVAVECLVEVVVADVSLIVVFSE